MRNFSTVSGLLKAFIEICKTLGDSFRVKLSVILFMILQVTKTSLRLSGYVLICPRFDETSLDVFKTRYVYF